MNSTLPQPQEKRFLVRFYDSNDSLHSKYQYSTDLFSVVEQLKIDSEVCELVSVELVHPATNVIKPPRSSWMGTRQDEGHSVVKLFGQF